MADEKTPYTIPFLGATENNNGITGFVNKEVVLTWDKEGKRTNKHINERIYKGNAIAVTNNGSVGNAYYVKKDFTCSHDINVLYLKDQELTEELGLFLISCIEQSADGFSYGIKWRPKRMVKSKILIPTDENGKPNWTFMEKFIKEKKVKQKDTIASFLSKQSNKIGEFERVKIKSTNWKSFVLGDVVNIKNGTRLTKANMEAGNLPFIGATERNNGITNFVSNSNESLDSNVLGINYNGSVCEGFYHPYNAIFSDDVKRITFKKGINNEYTLLFLITTIQKQKAKFAYGYKFNATRMAKTKILLPIDNVGNIDYEFMENYIKQIKKDKIEKVMSFILGRERGDIPKSQVK